jgi:hypothetical protein
VIRQRWIRQQSDDDQSMTILIEKIMDRTGSIDVAGSPAA